MHFRYWHQAALRLVDRTFPELSKKLPCGAPTTQRSRLKSYPSLDNFRLSLGQKDFCCSSGIRTFRTEELIKARAEAADRHKDKLIF